MTLRNILFIYKHKKACKRLQRIVEANRKAPATREFVKRRDAMLRHTRAQAS